MVTRRFLLSACVAWASLPPMLLAGCADGPPAPALAAPASTPLDYSYLGKLPLRVAALDFDDQAPASGIAPAGDSVSGALMTMGRQRLEAAGDAGRAVFTISQAEIQPAPGGLQGSMRVRLDIAQGEGPVAYAEASAARTLTGPAPDQPAAARELLRQMMDDMNVEFEYQVRHALAAWLVTDQTRPNPVQASDLPAP